jgi:hypothetical protein
LNWFCGRLVLSNKGEPQGFSSCRRTRNPLPSNDAWEFGERGNALCQARPTSAFSTRACRQTSTRVCLKEGLMAGCGSEADYTPGIMGSDCLPMARGSRLGQIARVNLRTTYGQLRGEKYRSLVPKRHQIKHLGFLLRWFGTRRPVVQIHSPRPLFFFCFSASFPAANMP